MTTPFFDCNYSYRDLAYWLFSGDYINDMNFNDYMDSTTVNVAAVSMLDMSELL